MASIDDWAAKVAQRIAEEPDYHKHGQSPQQGVTRSAQWESRIAAIIATSAEPLIQIVRDAKREHTFAIDASKAPGRDMIVAGCAKKFFPHEPCTCGADAWNARVDAVLDGKTG